MHQASMPPPAAAQVNADSSLRRAARIRVPSVSKRFRRISHHSSERPRPKTVVLYSDYERKRRRRCKNSNASKCSAIHALVEQLVNSTKHDRIHTARLLAELGEVHSRGLFRDLGFSTMFDYATQKLRMSEAEASLRLRAAKLGRSFPIALEMLGRSEVNLTTLSLLAPLLSADTLHLLQDARFKSKQEVVELIARHAPKPDVPDRIRRLPRARVRTHSHTGPREAPPAGVSGPVLQFTDAAAPAPVSALAPQPALSPLEATPRAPLADFSLSAVASRAKPAAMIPLSAERHEIRFTASQRVRDMVEQARDLRRHRYPGGDLEPLFERALELLIAEEQKRRFALTRQPRSATKSARRSPQANESGPHSRHIPNAVRRVVWERDEGRCCFRRATGERCSARSLLEFHHVVPFARAGAHTAENIVLLCRAHNGLCAERDYSREFVEAQASRARLASTSRTATRSNANAFPP